MRNHPILGIVVIAALSLPLVLFAQTDRRPAPAKARAASGTPDLSGVWYASSFPRNILPNEDPPFQPWAKALFEKRKYDDLHHDPDIAIDPVEKCLPPGVPQVMLRPFPWEIVQARDRVVMIFEFQSLVRQIFTDGRGHPKDLEPTYMGHSIGKWDGDTLVVDSVGFNDKTWLDPMGLPHSDALHVTERIRRVKHDLLVDDAVIDDPKAYTKPWTVHKTFDLKPDWQLQEYVCAENNTVK